MRTSVIVTKPSLGSRRPLSRRRAMISFTWSPSLAARPLSAMGGSLPSRPGTAPSRRSGRIRRHAAPDRSGTACRGILRIRAIRGPLGADLLAGLDRLDLVADLDVVEPAESD